MPKKFADNAAEGITSLQHLHDIMMVMARYATPVQPGESKYIPIYCDVFVFPGPDHPGYHTEASAAAYNADQLRRLADQIREWAEYLGDDNDGPLTGQPPPQGNPE